MDACLTAQALSKKKEITPVFLLDSSTMYYIELTKLSPLGETAHDKPPSLALCLF